jgi:molecular chaperone GrpE
MENFKEKDSQDKKSSKADSQEVVQIPAAEHEELLKKSAELELIRDRVLRSAADFENAKKRLAKERDDFVKFAQEGLIREALPVLDNFERALSHAGEIKDASAKNVVSGIQMVFKQFNEILKNQGLKRLQTVGQKFDPHQHEALGYVYEKGPEDEIVEEIEPGYLLHDRLLRAAKVRVRMPPASSPHPDSGEKQEEIT